MYLLDRLGDLRPDTVAREEGGADGLPSLRRERSHRRGKGPAGHPRQDGPLQQPPERHACPHNPAAANRTHVNPNHRGTGRAYLLPNNNTADQRDRPSLRPEFDRAKPSRFVRNSIAGKRRPSPDQTGGDPRKGGAGGGEIGGGNVPEDEDSRGFAAAAGIVSCGEEMGGEEGENGKGKMRRRRGWRLFLGFLRFIGPSIWIGRLGLGGPTPVNDAFLSCASRREEFGFLFFRRERRRLSQSWPCGQFYSILIFRKTKLYSRST